MKVAVRVRPMNKRGKSVGVGVCADGVRARGLSYGCVGSVDVLCIPTNSYTRTTHTSRMYINVSRCTCMLCVCMSCKVL